MEKMNLLGKLGYGLLILAIVLSIVSVVILRSDTIVGWIIPFAITCAILSAFVLIVVRKE